MEKGEMDSILEAYSILTREYKLNQATLDKSETVKNKIEKRFFCKIKTSLAGLLVLLLEKCERLFGKDFWIPANTNNQYDNQFIVQVSDDGARHQETQEGHTNVINFNCCFSLNCSGYGTRLEL